MVKFIRDATGPGQVIDRRSSSSKKKKYAPGHVSMSSKPRKTYMNQQFRSKSQGPNPFPKGSALNPIVRTGRGSRRRPTSARKAR